MQEIKRNRTPINYDLVIESFFAINGNKDFTENEFKEWIKKEYPNWSKNTYLIIYRKMIEKGLFIFHEAYFSTKSRTAEEFHIYESDFNRW